MRLNLSSAKWRPFCLGLNVLTEFGLVTVTAYDNIIYIDLDQHWLDGTKPLPEAMLTYHQWDSVALT